MRRSGSAFVVSCLLLYGCGGGGGSGGASAPTSTPTRRTGQATATPGGPETRTPTLNGQVTSSPTPGPQGTRTATPAGQRTRTRTPTLGGQATRSATPGPQGTSTATPAGPQGTRTATPAGQRTRTSTPTAIPTKALFVRESGNDENPGTSPDAALRTLAHAAEVVEPGTTVFVGPGRYVGRVALNGRAGTPSSPIEIIADTGGAHTGDRPGTVNIDAGGDIVALILTRSTYVSVDSFLINGALPDPGNASATAVQLRTASNNVTIRNCVIANGADADGVRVNGSSDALIFNNLIFQNDRGILITGDAQRTRVINNTIITHQRASIALTLNAGVAPIDTTVLNNVMQGNETNIAISVAEGPPSALEGYSGDFNAVFEPGIEDQSTIYNPTSIRGEHDVNADPLLSNVGQGEVPPEPGSPAIDAGTDAIGPALVNALLQRSTAPDGAADQAPVDMGYHYPR